MQGLHIKKIIASTALFAAMLNGVAGSAGAQPPGSSLSQGKARPAHVRAGYIGRASHIGIDRSVWGSAQPSHVYFQGSAGASAHSRSLSQGKARPAHVRAGYISSVWGN